MQHPLLKRRELTDKTRLRFKGKAFEWGAVDCIHMARFHMVSFGHALPRIPAYKGALGAVRAVKRNGWDNLEDMFDEFLPRIIPASRLIGDIVLMEAPAGEPLDAVTVSVGPNVMGWAEGYDETVMIIPKKIKAAWSVML